MKQWLAVPFALLSLFALDRCSRKNGLDAEDILAVRPGMTMDEVEEILGKPFDMEVRSDHMFVCRCNPERLCREPQRTTWTYTRKPLTRFTPYWGFPMLWVHFNSRGKVNTVYAKRYFAMGVDSEGIYMKKLSPCDTTDQTMEQFGNLDDEAKAIKRLRTAF
ncbi:MAG: hypothetical protein IPJ85_00995 [Flavobacteriales bacterium]|nr:hypothetical protein [Flavobacteriales bacterium]